MRLSDTPMRFWRLPGELYHSRLTDLRATLHRVRSLVRTDRRRRSSVLQCRRSSTNRRSDTNANRSASVSHPTPRPATLSHLRLANSTRRASDFRPKTRPDGHATDRGCAVLENDGGFRAKCAEIPRDDRWRLKPTSSMSGFESLLPSAASQNFAKTAIIRQTMLWPH